MKLKLWKNQKVYSLLCLEEKKGERYYDIAHPINQEVRDKLTKAVLEKYEEAEDPEPVEKTEAEDAE